MPRKGLTKQSVIDAAVKLIEEQGNQNFSLNELARQLDIKPASLYNHIQNMDELTDEVGSRIAGMLRQAELDAIEGKRGDEALTALCHAYRAFAKKHIELYKVNIGKQLVGRDFERIAKGEIIDPIFKVLADYCLEKNERLHWHRVIRVMMHGFISQENASSFRRFPIDIDETYQMAIHTIMLGIHAAEKGKKNEQV